MADMVNIHVYWMNVDTGKRVRLTFFPGADVLPMFSPDCKRIMWTSNRSPDGTSQLFIADFILPKE